MLTSLTLFISDVAKSEYIARAYPAGISASASVPMFAARILLCRMDQISMGCAGI